MVLKHNLNAQLKKKIAFRMNVCIRDTLKVSHGKVDYFLRMIDLIPFINAIVFDRNSSCLAYFCFLPSLHHHLIQVFTWLCLYFVLYFLFFLR